MRYAVIYPILWAIFCIPLLFLMTIFGLGNHVPVVLMYTLFLIISYVVIKEIEKKRAKFVFEKTRWVINFCAIVSIAATFINFICMLYGIIWHFYPEFDMKIPVWIGVFYPAAGAPIALVIWFYVVCKMNKVNNFIMLLSKMEAWMVGVSTYLLSLSMDYFNLLIGHPPGLGS